MAFNLGALMPGAQTDMNAKIAQTLAGQGSPDASAPSPTTATQAAPGQTPSPTYAPDPQNASTIQQLLQLHQRDSLMNGLSYDLRRIGASFGTAQQQASSMAALGAPPQEDTLGALGKIEAITAEQTKQNEHSQFMAGADVMGQQILGLKPGQGAWLAKSGNLPEILQTHFNQMAPTDAIKDYNFARQALRDQGLSEDEINKRIPPDMIVSAIGGQTPVEKDMRADIQRWKASHPGGTDAEMYAEHPGWTTLTGYAAEKAEETKTAAVAAQDKVNSKANLSDVQRASKPVLDNINDMIANLDHTITAIKYPEVASGTLGQGFGAAGLTDQKTLDMRSAVQKLQDQLKSDAMRNMKNIRTQREFDAIGGAASGIFDRTNSPERIRQGLLDLKARFELANANATAAAGGEVPAEYADQVNRDYLTKGSPLYNGATVEKALDLTGKSQQEADDAVAALPPGGKFKGPDGKWHTKNFGGS